MLRSNMKLCEVIEEISCFSPVKIIFNDTVVYNDYDDCPGETESYRIVVRNRIPNYNDATVTSIHIDIVQHHHSIITIQGKN